MELLSNVGRVASTISSVVTLLVLIISPIRDRLFGLGKIREGEKCLLRNAMTRIYYTLNEKKQITQNEYTNFQKLYEAYKALDGNSFVDKLHEDIQGWTIV